MPDDSYPRLAARTHDFNAGLPRGFVVSPDGTRMLFLRSASGFSMAQSLWLFDVTSGRERLVADPMTLLDGPEEFLTEEERARRERMRVRGSGIVAMTTDTEVTRAAFALSSRLFVVDLAGEASPREWSSTSSVIDPCLDPTGRRVAYAGDDGLHVVDGADGDRLLIGPEPGEPAEVRWGLAEFAAAEELGRARGFWWAPDGESLLVERYDESDVTVWHIADPAHPETEPARLRYPVAGTDNARVSLALVSLDGQRVDVDWRSDAALDGHVLEYLAHVEWTGPMPLLSVLTRDQNRLEFRDVDPATGRSSLLRALTDDAWVELLPGTPRRLDSGALLHGLDVAETRHLAVDGEPFTPAGLQVRRVISVEDGGVLALVSPSSRAGAIVLARLGLDGSVEPLSDEDGIVTAAAGGDTVVAAQQTLRDPAVVTTVLAGGEPVGTVGSLAEPVPITVEPELLEVGSRSYPTLVLWPAGHVKGSRRLPVLMDPYGGPQVQTVVRSARSVLQQQWFADQGFVVVVADGRGMAGRGPAWDKLVRHDFIGTIDDQVEVLADLARRFPDDIDTSKVGIRGWSFGGYISALGVLRHPEVFGAAVAGAPTTDMRLYDTCYTERYLGHPDDNAAVYDANSLLPMAAGLSRPLLLVHGLADDNVVVAHTLRLSSALLAAGRPHQVLPLSGMTHMANDEVVAENLLLLQLDFLRRSLDIAP
ncbi:MAG: prolyl oligopeptidase family serine peptidase [Nocardioidaceae bacterium]